MHHVALLGYGYWGINLLRNLINSPEIDKITVCDIQMHRLDLVQKNNSSIFITTDYQEVLKNPEIDIVVIATPTSSHYELAKEALSHHKHTLVEKPLCTCSKQAEELYQLADINKKILFTDLTFLYNGAIEYIQNYIFNEQIGDIKYIDSTRVNLGIYQNDTNVIWDLATHDISIIQKILKQSPTHIRAISNQHKDIKYIDLVYIFLYYPNGMLVHINCSWSSPTKIRQMIIGGEKRMIIYDDVEPTQKIKIYDYDQPSHQSNRNTTLIDYRLGDITIPKFSTIEPLKKMLDTFFDCIHQQQYLCITPKENIEIIRILESVEKSLAQQGALISL
jgi:predicted dehydrogenase